MVLGERAIQKTDRLYRSGNENRLKGIREGRNPSQENEGTFVGKRRPSLPARGKNLKKIQKREVRKTEV